MKKISVIVPLYNERESLEELHRLIIKEIDAMDASGEIVFIDDGSTDGSNDVLSAIREKSPDVKVIRFNA
ncbi:MAG TPA: glycosyltransferase, partial [bacterium]|nr:glycosyltransferase [bacterium]